MFKFALRRSTVLALMFSLGMGYLSLFFNVYAQSVSVLLDDSEVVVVDVVNSSTEYVFSCIKFIPSPTPSQTPVPPTDTPIPNTTPEVSPTMPDGIAFTVELLGGKEVPPVDTDATGSAEFLLNTEANTLSYQITYSNLSSNETGAHIHGPAQLNQTAAVVHGLPTGSPKSGVWNYDELLEATILAGELYVNIHTEDYPGGELRGQIVNVATPTLTFAPTASITPTPTDTAVPSATSPPPTPTDNPDIKVANLTFTASEDSDSSATGTGTITVDTSTKTFTYDVTISGLEGQETSAHIHKPGTSGNQDPIVTDLPLGSEKSGSFTYPASEEAGLLAGTFYVHIHSDAHLGGEIRAQIEFDSGGFASGELELVNVAFDSVDSTANFRRPEGGDSGSKAKLPENLVDIAKGWVAIRVKIGFNSDDSLSPDPIFWDMTLTDPDSSQMLYYDMDSERFRLARDNAVGVDYPFVSGREATIVSTWDGVNYKLSVDGSPFVSGTAPSIPSPFPLIIGSSENQKPSGTVRQPNSDYYWAAAGSGFLTDADALTLYDFGNSDPSFSQLPGNPVFFWDATSASYQR